MNVCKVKEGQLQDLIESSYSEEEIMAWKKSLKAEVESDMGFQDLNKRIQNPSYNCASRFAVNSEDLFLATNFSWPPHATGTQITIT